MKFHYYVYYVVAKGSTSQLTTDNNQRREPEFELERSLTESSIMEGLQIKTNPAYNAHTSVVISNKSTESDYDYIKMSLRRQLMQKAKKTKGSEDSETTKGEDDGSHEYI